MKELPRPVEFAPEALSIFLRLAQLRLKEFQPSCGICRSPTLPALLEEKRRARGAGDAAFLKATDAEGRQTLKQVLNGVQARSHLPVLLQGLQGMMRGRRIPRETRPIQAQNASLQ
jgi:hypothetical protein